MNDVNSGNAVLIDVRRQDEWDAGHAKPALHLNSEKILHFGSLPEVDKAIPIYTYCQSGGRAGRVKNALLEAGYKEVHNLGGLRDWIAAGGEIESN